MLLLLWCGLLILGVALFGSLAWLWVMLFRVEMWLISRFGKLEALDLDGQDETANENKTRNSDLGN